jgi:hypothetical protein
MSDNDGDDKKDVLILIRRELMREILINMRRWGADEFVNRILKELDS